MKLDWLTQVTLFTKIQDRLATVVRKAQNLNWKKQNLTPKRNRKKNLSVFDFLFMLQFKIFRNSANSSRSATPTKPGTSQPEALSDSKRKGLSEAVLAQATKKPRMDISAAVSSAPSAASSSKYSGKIALQVLLLISSFLLTAQMKG